MGSLDLRPPGPDDAAILWSRLPMAPDRHLTRSILRHLVRRIADVMSVPTPTAFADANNDISFAQIVESLAPAICTPDLLGMACEQLMASPQRRSRGAHFTPAGVADIVVGCAADQFDFASIGSDITVWDPAAGGGAFLLAAARRIERDTSQTRAQIVENTYASDIDPIALEVCAAALELWCAGHATPVVHCGDALLDLPESWPTSFDLIVGNPPFLGQLTTDTSRDSPRRERLLVQFNDVAHGYVDESGLFLHLALSRMRSKAVVALVLPESILAARDAQRVRASADRLGSLALLWIDEGQSFAAAVDVVAPVFTACEPSHEGTIVVTGSTRQLVARRPTDGSWSPLLAAARGVPVVRSSPAMGVVGDLASVTAGFRQHFYGLDGAVGEMKGVDGDASAAQRELRLVTAGAIDPLWLRWGTRAVKFAGVKWDAPIVDLEAIEDAAVREWFRDRCVPKILLASQTKVLEAVADPLGTLLPSVPALSVEPLNEDDLWRLVAVIASPWASAWLAERSAGSGLSSNAFRVRASEVAALPLPAVCDAWDHGALRAAEAQAASSQHDMAAYWMALRGLGDAMMEAYGGGGDSSVIEWWWERLGPPEGFTDTAY